MSDTLAFTGTIVNPEWMPTWAVIEVLGSQDFFGHGKSVKANATVDGIEVTSALMPSGQGHHFISVSAALRKKLGKGVGDEVDVRISKYLTESYRPARVLSERATRLANSYWRERRNFQTSGPSSR